MRHAILILLASAALWGQTATKLSTGQLAPATPSTVPTLLVYLPASGPTPPQFILVALDPAGSVVLDQTVNPPVLRAVASAAVWTLNEASVSTGGNTLTLRGTPAIGTQLLVYRNGVRLTPTLDYTVASNVITFATLQTPQAGDNLLVDYRTK
jgi:hypothetical protein